MKQKKKFNKGITLIALIVTIIILLILSGITIATLTGDNGLFARAKQAKEEYSMSSAKEKLELILFELQTAKVTDNNYNENEYIDNKIQENEMSVNEDVVTVDGWKFEIDRSTLRIISSLGKGEESQKIKIASTVEVTSDYTKANIKLEITSENELNTVKVNEEDVTIPEKADGKYIIEKEVMENGNYTVYAKTSNEEYKNEIVKVENISEDTDISTVEELEAFRDRVNSGATYAGRTIRLKNDLDLKDIEWIPIGNYWASDKDKLTFNGIFDGENHTINNMTINIAKKQENNNCYATGFIGYLENGTLKNLVFNNPNVYAETENCIAVAVGNAYNDSTIENIKVLNGEINSTSYDIGGICGILQKDQGTNGSIIKNCYNNANIESTNQLIGGISGFNQGSTIENCYNAGKVYSTSFNIGGISGFNKGSTIESCYNAGEVYSTSYSVGGICGTSRNESIIRKCYNTGKITSEGKNQSYVGGIIGVNQLTSTVRSCYNVGDVTGKYANVGGIIGCNGIKNQGTQTVENVFNVGMIKKGTTIATANIGTSSNYLGTLIGYGVYNKTINGNYGNTTIEEMKSWDNDTIVQNLGNGFKKNTNNNLNQGLPILLWQ